MSTVQRIAKNTVVLIIASIASFIAGFFFTVYVARHLGAEGFGILAFALAFTAIFGIFTDIGLGSLTVREVARDRSLAAKYLGNIAILKLFLVIITFGLIALTINLLDYPPQTIKVVYLIALSTFFSAFNTMFFSIFQAYERMEFVSIGQILNSFLLLFGALFAINQGFSIIGFASLYLLGSIVTLGYSLTISIWKFAKPKIEVDFGFWKETLKQAWPFALAGIFISIFYWTDTVMLSFMKGNEAVGWYNAAYRLVSALSFIPIAYFSAVFPVMSRFYISSKESLRLIQEKSFKYLLLLAVPIGVGTTILANRIITHLFGSEYTHSVIALQILIWSMVLIFVGDVFANLFSSLNRQLLVTKIVAGGALLNVILNLILIPNYSYTGAGIATIATQFLLLVLYFIWSFKLGYGVPRKNLLIMIARVSVSSAAMCVFILHFSGLILWALIPVSALLYFAVLYIIRGIDKEDVLLLWQIVSRQRATDAVGGDSKSD